MSTLAGYFLDEADQLDLSAVLDEVPEIVDALAGLRNDGYRARISYEPRVSSTPADRIPYDTSAQDASDYLINELWTWTMHVHEHRGLTYSGSTSPAALSKWLRKNIVSLAMTPGSDEALPAIRRVVRTARRAARLPGQPERWRYGSTHVARNTELNASAIAVAAKELGPEYAKLDRKRVNNLKKLERIKPIREHEGVPIYRLGDVMDAHVAARSFRKSA